MHKEITSEGYKIYNVNKARELYKDKKFTHKQLSIMKQENIQEAIMNKNYDKDEVFWAIDKRCGYCFKYYNATYRQGCTDCPFINKNSLYNNCLTKEYYEFENVLKKEGRFQRKKALEAHKAWLKSIKLNW